MENLKQKLEEQKYQLYSAKVYDSRIGSHSYAAWTEGYVFAIIDVENKQEVTPRFAMENDINGNWRQVEIGSNEDYAIEKCNMEISKMDLEKISNVEFKVLIDGEEINFSKEKELEKTEDMKKEKKEYGRNVAKLAKALDVKWEEAKVFYNPKLTKSEVEQLKEEIQTAREMAIKNMYRELRHELFECGKYRQEEALRGLLGLDNMQYQELYLPSSANGVDRLMDMTVCYALEEYNKDVKDAIKNIYEEGKSIEDMKKECDIAFRNLGNSGCLDYDNLRMLKTGEGLQTELKQALLNSRKEYCQEIKGAYATVAFVAQNAKYEAEVIKALELFESQNYALDVLRDDDREVILDGIQSICDEIEKRQEYNRTDRVQ